VSAKQSEQMYQRHHRTLDSSTQTFSLSWLEVQLTYLSLFASLPQSFYPEILYPTSWRTSHDYPSVQLCFELLPLFTAS